MNTEGASISDYRAKFCGKDFVLRATTEALAAIETELGDAYPVVFNRMTGRIPRLLDVSAAFAAFALPHGKYTAKAIRGLMPFDGGQTLLECVNHVNLALIAASPEAKKGTDETEEAGKKSDPQSPQPSE